VARQTAELALRALRGENPDRIPVVEIKPNINIFDWRQLRRWRISEGRLPPDSIVRFREPSFWDLYKWRIIGVVSLCMVEGLLIFALLAQRAMRRRVEEALRDNEERLNLVLGAANMGAWDWRLGANDMTWSEEMRRIFGLANGKSSVTPRAFLDLIHPDDRSAVAQAVARTIKEGVTYDLEFRTVHEDGSMHWVMGKGKALLDKAGRAARMLGVNMDITDRKRAQERLRSYFELPLIGMAITSPDRRFVEVNQKLCDILGYSMDQLTGMSWVDVTHPDDMAENLRLLDETLRGKTEGYVMDKRFIHRDGHIIYTSISARCARRADRTVDYLALIVQDITQRKEAEDRLMESEAQLRLLTELIPQHVWTGIPGNIADYRNQRWLDYTGMTIEEVRHKGWMTALHPDDHEVVINAIREASLRKGIYEVEIRLKGVDGQYRWFLARAIPQLDQEGKIIKWYGTNTDIEDRKQAEEALRESEARFRNMADNAPVMVWVTEADGVCSYVSQSWYEFTGQTPETSLGFGWVGALHPDDRELSEKTFLAANEKREAFRLEYRLRRNDGEYRWASDSARPRFGSLGEFLGYIGSVVDITETKRAELNTQFINQLDFELSQIADADEIIRLATSRLGEYLGVTNCYVIEVNPAAGLALVRESWDGWPRDGKIIVGGYRTSDYATPEFRENLEAGQAAIVNDVMTDPRTRDFASKYESLGVGAFISIPALNENQLEASLTVNYSQARDWRPDETQLMRDITARLWPAFKRARALEALRDSEERYRSVVESQTELICRYLPDTTLTFVNDAYCRYFRKTQEELIGTKFLDFIPETAREVARKHIESLVEKPRIEMDEHEVLLPDGGIGWQQWVDHAILDVDGKVVEFQAVGRDITERKQIEEERRESEERLRLALEAGRMGVWEWETRTNAVKWSKEHYTVMGLMPFSVEPDYQSWADRVHPDDLPVATETMSRAIEEKGEYRCEYRIIWSDGSMHWVEGRGKPVYDKGGRCLKVSGLIVDITERKEAEEALRESEEALRKSYARIEDLAGRLIAAQEEERRYVARELHDDLNQQVAALAIGISRLKRQFSNADAAVLEQIAKLRDKTDLLSERIRQVSHELHSSILQHVGLPAALNSYCAEFSDREGIAVALDIGDEVEAVPPDAALCLYRVAQESLRNVARHSGARRAVVTLAGVNGAVELRVADQGVGFDHGQARECRGLGLVSMEERVKLLHGSFVLTTRPGAGTELRAQIPLRRGHEQTAGTVG
jgi:PAS domain S-box-containing protein